MARQIAKGPKAKDLIFELKLAGFFKICKFIDWLYGPCRYRKICEGYQKDGYTCNHELEAGRMCGIHKDRNEKAGKYEQRT